MADVTEAYENKSPGGITGSNTQDWGKTCLVFSAGLKDYTCDGGAGLITPFNSALLAPFVICKISGEGGFSITVGNESTTGNFPKNSAAITEFNCGMSDGVMASIEIIDECGGAFTNFFEKGLAKCITNVNDMYNIEVTFGWIGANCDGSVQGWPGSPSTLYFMLLSVDIFYGEGKIKYKLNCVDMINGTNVVKVKKSFNCTLKKAIIDMLAYESPVIDVAFLRIPEGGGEPQSWKFINEGITLVNTEGRKNSASGEGPVGPWACENMPKLECLRKWIQKVTTENKKGIVPIWDATKKRPTLILWEDAMLSCKVEGSITCKRSLGTFIINGGNCSSVVSFKPSINWIPSFASAASGGNVGVQSTMQSQMYTNEINGEAGNKCATFIPSYVGSEVSVPASSTDHKNYGKETPKILGQNQKANAKASAIHELVNPIQATLTILGNASREFIEFIKWKSALVTLIVINPFSILVGDGTDRCGDWSASSSDNSGLLVNSNINKILTNRNWFVNMLTHSIKGGKYVTELQLVLPSPGFDIPVNYPLGGDANSLKIGSCPEEQGAGVFSGEGGGATFEEPGAGVFSGEGGGATF